MACKSSANMEISTVLNSQRRPAIPASDLLPAQKERKLSTPLVKQCINHGNIVCKVPSTLLSSSSSDNSSSFLLSNSFYQIAPIRHQRNIDLLATQRNMPS